MVLDTFKKYPSQISGAFRRFPVASALAVFSTLAFIFSNEIAPSRIEQEGHSFCFWLVLYPVGAMLLSIITTLVQEARKNTSKVPQIATGIAWFVISIALILYYPEEPDYYRHAYLFGAIYSIYATLILGLFVAPFFRQNNENQFWIFLHKNLKALFIAIGITGVLTLAIEGLIYGSVSLFDLGKISGKPYLYVFFFCRNTILPMLYLAGLPSIDERLDETPTSSKFTSGVCKLFIAVFTLYVALLYAYIAKILVQWDLPKGMVSYLVSASMLIMFLLVTEMYPAQLNPIKKIEKRLLKIFPAACIPLVILMTFGIIRRISDYGISEDRIYVFAINIYFYIIIAILLINKIKCKFRYLAIVFCAMLFVLMTGPFNATKITRDIWIDSIKATLAEEGYTKFPLNAQDTKSFLNTIDDKSPIVYSRVHILQNRSKKELAEFFETDSIYTDYNAILSTPPKDADKNKPKTLLHGSYSTNKTYDIPPYATRMEHIDKKFNKDEFELRNDTIFFQIAPKKSEKAFHFAFPYKARAPEVPCTPEQIENSRKRMGENFNEKDVRCRDMTFRDDIIEANDNARIFKEMVHLDRKIVDGDTILNFEIKGIIFME